MLWCEVLIQRKANIYGETIIEVAYSMESGWSLMHGLDTCDMARWALKSLSFCNPRGVNLFFLVHDSLIASLFFYYLVLLFETLTYIQISSFHSILLSNFFVHITQGIVFAKFFVYILSL